MNYEAAAADIRRFLTIVKPAQAALDALTLAAQLQDSLTAARASLDAALAEHERVNNETVTARAVIADEQAKHAAYLVECRAHVDAAKAAVKDAQRAADAEVAAAHAEIAQARSDAAAVHRAAEQEHQQRVNALLADAEALEARIAAAREAAAKMIGG